MKTPSLIFYACALALVVFLSIAGCGVAHFTAETVVDYETPGGVKAHYKSNKDQQDFKAKVSVDEQGRIKDLDIQTTATTPEAAIAAAAQANALAMQMLADVLKQLLPLLQKAAAAGATAGS
jgi:hypothetical protein